MDVLVPFFSSVYAVNVLILTALQFTFSFLWFNVLVHHFDTYYLAADKGVRSAHHALRRYPEVLVHITNIVCCMLRALAVLFVAHLSNATTVLDFQYAAVFVSLASMLAAHRHFAYQRPVQLFVSIWGFEVAASMIVAAGSFYLKK